MGYRKYRGSTEQKRLALADLSLRSEFPNNAEDKLYETPVPKNAEDWMQAGSDEYDWEYELNLAAGELSLANDGI